ncbi:MAG: glycosyltransferase [Clostridium tyrobutyricum]|uniref:tetratricopeptide repeat-containing glycosyltransferase family 2 protein n=1 Tax=Clostridium tyrobutyricum TaxID=1519 RepID=UPI00242F7993|nr:glycosyltransferase [Clostridium tyrobutyricum]MCH4259677.1 glycosyltransferase [Clostridium tyrobutyricum]MCI1240112.1 glycosyltransferase [Clostridium tyrobutyricum]MCI1651632.1 glycosyltransferase [Clostridium tyrobutyricum]MCI1938480.1 glycosyltransferase [Clostridium tyrobutyricum]MCI1993820.1 glycosyltransferase [Clostridium tyrobutyricum]
MKLSICMMVKNEEKNLHRCLESLKPILEQIDSELVIVDTGSSDNTVEIARQYTDKVYFHKWNNDFSSMRNITIGYAKGEWILIIDADEKIEDTSEIILFLNSIYANKYKSVDVNIKNITNIEDNRYGIISSPRMFLNDGTFRYEGRIHNIPIYKKPTVVLNITFLHYGYIETDTKLMKKKFLRTSSILIEEIKKDPKNIYYNYQLAVSYAMYKDYDKALKQIIKTYKIINDRKLNKKDYVYIYYEMASYYYFAGDSTKYKIIEDICKEGIQLEKEYIDLYFLLGKISIFTNNFVQAQKSYKEYINLLENYKNLSIYKNTAFKLYTLDRLEETYYDLSFIFFNLKKYKECIIYIKKLSSGKYIEKAFELIVKSYLKLKKHEELKEYYNENIVCLDKNKLRIFYSYLELEIDKSIEEDRVDIISKFSGNNDTYSFLNKIRVYYNSEYENLGQLVNKFVRVLDLNYEPNYFGDLIYYKIKLKDDIYDMLSNVSMNKIEEFIVYIANKYDDFKDTAYNYITQNINSDFQVIRVNRLLDRFVLVMDKLNEEQYRFIFKDYVNSGIKYISVIYSNEILDNEMIYDVKNDEDSFFIFMNKANQLKTYNEKEYIKYLRKALELYPFMKKGIGMLLDDFKNKFNAKNNEFENYKKKVKITIKAFIDNNKLDEANKIIAEYEQIVKDDLEVVLFKSKISLKKLSNVNTSYKM